MKMGKRHNLHILFLVTTLLFSLIPMTGRQEALALSIEDENKLGKEFLANINKYYELVDDDFANEYLNELGNYLLIPLETKHFPFQFYIINSNELNAFAGPGGHIFVFTGLIGIMEELDDLAAVICHEIGHVSARHISERIEQNKKIGLATLAGILAGSLLGGELSGAVITGSVAAGIQKQLSYSRNDERQADQLSVGYMEKAGFDPAGMIRALTQIQNGQWTGTNKIPPYLLTHPVSTERISNIESMLASRSATTEREETDHFRGLYPFFRTILKARYLDSQEAERSFNADLEKDPDSPLALFGLGILLKERAEYPEAIDRFKRSIKGLSRPIPVLRHLGETYQLAGQDREAIKVLNRALAIDGRDKPSLFLLALSYQNLGEYSKASSILERLSSMEPVRDEVYYNLGVSLGRQERLGLAHYYFGIYFKRLKKRQEADFHFHKARELAGNDPDLKEKLRKALEDKN